MARRFAVVMFVVVAVGLMFGCGKRETPMDTAPKQAPVDIGSPVKWPLGVTVHEDHTWIVKKDYGGEVRLFALAVKAQTPSADETQWDSDNEIFYTKGRKFRYSVEGDALHEAGGGEDVKPKPMRRRPVELDQTTGNILLYTYGKVQKPDWEDTEKQGYLVVP